MRIFVAGATGALGKPLLPLLTERRYDVYAMTKSQDKTTTLERQGVHAVVVDAFDGVALQKHLAAIKPDAVVHLLTDLPFGTPAAHMAEGTVRNAHMRREGTRNLIEGALAAQARRIVDASIARVYGEGRKPHVEGDPVNVDVPEPAKTTMLGVVEMERRVLETPPLSGIVLRYGHLYGPATGHDARDTAVSVHVEDAARAALLALESTVEGIVNVVDDNDEVSNAKARSVLGWAPSAQVSS